MCDWRERQRIEWGRQMMEKKRGGERVEVKAVVHVELRQMSGIDEAQSNTDTQTLLQQDKLIPAAEFSSRGLTDMCLWSRILVPKKFLAILKCHICHCIVLVQTVSFRWDYSVNCICCLFPIIRTEVVHFDRNHHFISRNHLWIKCNYSFCGIGVFISWNCFNEITITTFGSEAQ